MRATTWRLATLPVLLLHAVSRSNASTHAVTAFAAATRVEQGYACRETGTHTTAFSQETDLDLGGAGQGSIQFLARSQPQRQLYRVSRGSTFTNWCIASNVLGFAATLLRPPLMMQLAKNDALVKNGQLYRLLTSCWLHAGPLHLAVNCNSLSNIGPEVESLFGRQRFALTYLVSGVAGNLLSLASGTAPVAVGASGAVFGLLGSYTFFLMRNQRVLESRGMRGVDRTLSALGRTCLMNLVIGLSPGSRIDNMGHLGGFLGGMACAYSFGPRLLAPRGPMGPLIDQPLIRLPDTTRRRKQLQGVRRYGA